MRFLTLTVGQVAGIISAAILVGSSLQAFELFQFESLTNIREAHVAFPIIMGFIVVSALRDTNNAATWYVCVPRFLKRSTCLTH
jgi:predicted component of type VI protein secretion system